MKKSTILKVIKNIKELIIMEELLIILLLFAICGMLGLIGIGLEAIINKSLDRKDKRIERAEINQEFKAEMRDLADGVYYEEVI